MAEIAVGVPAPDFTLPASDGNHVRLSDFRGKNVVLYFYPKDMTPGCTQQACDFRDAHAPFEQVDAVILGISPDPIKRHEKFIEKHQLPFLLLADEHHEICELYGVWKEKSMYGKKFWGVERTTFLIDKEGNIAQIYAKVKVKGHVEAVLRDVEGR